MLAAYLDVPVDWLRHIRTRREALVLTNVGTAAVKIDALLATQSEMSTTRRTLLHLVGDAASKGRDSIAMVPLLNEALASTHNAELSGQTNDCRSELIGLAAELEYFVEMNESSAKEFEEAGCSDRASAKRLVASVERTLAQRILWIATGGGATGAENLWAHTTTELCAASV